MRALTRPAPARVHSRARGTAQTARAFTLIEVVVVAAVASIIFLVLTRWVLTLGTVSSLSLEQSGPARTSAYAATRLSADITSATICDTSTRNPVRQLTSDTLEVYLSGPDPLGQPTTYLARWKVTGTTLTRTLFTVDPSTGSCDATGTAYGERVIANDVAAPTATRPAFTAVVAGHDSDGCTLVTTDTGTQQSTGPGCAPDAITVSLVMRSADDNKAPAALDDTYQLPTIQGQL